MTRPVVLDSPGYRFWLFRYAVSGYFGQRPRVPSAAPVAPEQIDDLRWISLCAADEPADPVRELSQLALLRSSAEESGPSTLERWM
jgi:hypothetical protein